MCATDDEATLADAGKYGIAVAVTEVPARARFFEQIDGIGVTVRGNGA
jgi:hypothetical protein